RSVAELGDAARRRGAVGAHDLARLVAERHRAADEPRHAGGVALEARGLPGLVADRLLVPVAAERDGASARVVDLAAVGIDLAPAPGERERAREREAGAHHPSRN